jgi:3-hydroxy acid dehydrogenase / malonic semialdehyde reductase
MILITGASSGIGAATARLFAQQKRGLILLARRKERLGELAKSLGGTEVHTFALDVRDQSALEKFARTEQALLSRVEVLVNNAGLARGLDLFQDGNPADWEEMIETNLKGLLTMTRLVLPHLMARKRGHIVNMGSAAGFFAYPKGNVYSATKAAVRALTEGLRLDLMGTGVRVTEISPGMVDTEFSTVRLRDADRAKNVYAGMTPLSAEDIAEAIVWSVNRPPHMNVQEMILYPTDQASTTHVHRRS